MTESMSAYADHPWILVPDTVAPRHEFDTLLSCTAERAGTAW
jgi:hypothetical protein